MQDELLKYKIAITLIHKIGSINAKKLIAYVGSVEGVFKEKKKMLLKIPGIGLNLAQNILNKKALEKAEKEIEFIQKHDINTLFYLDKNYPKRLKQCDDGPVIMYSKGNTDFNTSKIISIVGTRNATHIGRETCENLIIELKNNGHNPLIVSGLAYGIDICAHRTALNNNLQTVAVLGHGLDRIYPATHRETAKSIMQNGALLTEFLHESKVERTNFVKRNRIIAGLADATIVVESAAKGGALITASIANSYSRDVFAFPGRTTDKYSTGCNHLIKTNKAALIENAVDLEYFLQWDTKNKQAVQTSLFNDLSEEEQSFVNLIEKNDEMHIDNIATELEKPISVVASTLFTLEFAGIIKALPGNMYVLRKR